MKINRSLTEILIIVGFFMWIGSAGPVQGAPSGPVAGETAKALETETGYLENITFEKLKGKERVVLMLSRQSGATAEDQGSQTVMIKVENLFVPQDLRRAMGEGVLDNLIRVVPAQQTVGGKPQALIGIELHMRVPYSVRQDRHQMIIDFNVAALPARPAGTATADKPALQEPGGGKAAAPVKTPPLQVKDAPPPYAGRLISLELQDAGIKSVLQLLAEESGVNIVSGDDVKGNITVHMKKVPWEQALETILVITQMTKKQQGNMITVMTMKRKLEDEKARKDAEKEQRDGESERKKEALAKMLDEGRQRQISIEAKIVEATDGFFRGLGVQWGGGYGKADNFGALIGTNPAGGIRSLPDGIGLTSEKLAVNFPTSVLAPSIGLVLGSAEAVLSAQLQALETNSQGKVISSPKVTTMDGVKAIIKQGDEIPYVTKDSQGTPTVNWKEATLSLAVTPKITPDGKISMDVLAKNDTPLYERAVELQGNVPIRKSEVTSMVVVQDGETLVIGGILKTEESKNVSGLPWIAKIPVLGWLFKTENTSRNRRQVMVFITPRIIKTEQSSPDKSVMDTTGKPRGSWQP